MKKVIIPFIILLALCLKPEVQAQSDIWNGIKNRISASKCIKFTCIQKDTYGNHTIEHLPVMWLVSNDTMICLNSDFYAMCTKDSLWMISISDSAISFGAKNPDTTFFPWNVYNFFKNVYFGKILKVMPLYVNLDDTDPQYVLSQKEDVQPNGNRIIERRLLTGYQQNDSTKAFDVPVVDTIKYFYNENTGWIDKSRKSNQSGNIIWECFFEDISTDVLQQDVRETLSLFNISDKKYSGFQKFNFNLEFSCFKISPR